MILFNTIKNLKFGPSYNHINVEHYKSEHNLKFYYFSLKLLLITYTVINYVTYIMYICL